MMQTMVIQRAKRVLPNAVKHPLLTWSDWFWNLRGLPAQAPEDISIFKAVLLAVDNPKIRVFEWGSGRSTIYYANFLRSVGRDFDWQSMDNSREWSQRGQEKIKRAQLGDWVHVYCSEFPAFWQIPGYAHDNVVLPNPWSDSENVAEYVDFPKSLGYQFDVIIVDGRFRRRCLLAAKEVLAPNGILILHDAQREHYHSSLSSYPQVRSLVTGRLPGSRQKSTITMCSLSEIPFIRDL